MSTKANCIEKIHDCIIDFGPRPAYHIRQLKRLRRNRPLLYSALMMTLSDQEKQLIDDILK